MIGRSQKNDCSLLDNDSIPLDDHGSESYVARRGKSMKAGPPGGLQADSWRNIAITLIMGLCLSALDSRLRTGENQASFPRPSTLKSECGLRFCLAFFRASAAACDAFVAFAFRSAHVSAFARAWPHFFPIRESDRGSRDDSLRQGGFLLKALSLSQ
jgi:hypothetical protein